MKRSHGLLALLLAVGLAAGCAKREDRTPAAARVEAGAVVDLEVMAFLSEARALHHEANVREDEGDLPAAVAAIKRLVTAARPHPNDRVPEVEEVLADAFARIAELEVKGHRLDAAGDAVQQGLAHAPDPTYFRGHLLEVQGIVEEARGTDLADAGKPAEAARARAKAIDLLHEAVLVQEKVIGRALDGGAR